MAMGNPWKSPIYTDNAEAEAKRGVWKAESPLGTMGTSAGTDVSVDAWCEKAVKIIGHHWPKKYGSAVKMSVTIAERIGDGDGERIAERTVVSGEFQAFGVQ